MANVIRDRSGAEHDVRPGLRVEDRDHRVSHRWATVERVEPPYAYIVRDKGRSEVQQRSRVRLDTLRRRFWMISVAREED